jgi:hypothetical protein
MTDHIKAVVAPAAIDRALGIYQQMHDPDEAGLTAARQTLSDKVQELVAAGESDETRLVVGALAHLKALDRARSGSSAGDAGE